MDNGGSERLRPAKADNSTDFSRCLHILCSLSAGGSFKPFNPGTSRPSSSQLLRARHGFRTLQEKQLSHIGSDLSVVSKGDGVTRSTLLCLVHVAAMHGLFECLVHGLAASSAVFNSYVAALDEHCDQQGQIAAMCRWAREAVLSACIRLFFWYSNRHQATATSVKIDLLQRALSLHPDNTEWLQLICRLHTQSHLMAQLRRFVDQTVLSCAQSPVSWLVAVIVEDNRRQRLQSVGGLSQEVPAGDWHDSSHSLVAGTGRGIKHRAACCVAMEMVRSV